MPSIRYFPTDGMIGRERSRSLALLHSAVPHDSSLRHDRESWRKQDRLNAGAGVSVDSERSPLILHVIKCAGVTRLNLYRMIVAIIGLIGALIATRSQHTR